MMMRSRVHQAYPEARSVCIAALLLLMLPATVSAQSLSLAISSFDEGNRKYRQGDFEGALESYREALRQEYESAALYYNMGNTFFRLDEIGQSVRHYEKARRLEPTFPELQHNLEIVRERMVDRFSRLPEPFWRPAWNFLVRTFGPVGLFAVGIVFYVIAGGALALKIREGQTPWRRRTLTVGAAAAICFLSLSLLASAEQLRRTGAVILPNEVTLLNEPNGSESDLRIHEGLVVDILSSANEWSEVRLPNGATGWVRSDALGEI